MPLPSLPSLLAVFIASAACCAALAASNVGTKLEASDKDLIAKKRNQCKQDCIRGC